MPPRHANSLLAQLASESLDALRLSQVDLVTGRGIYEPDQPVEYAYFPEKGVLSVVSQLADGRNIEVETIGNESMAGSFIVLDVDRIPFKTFVQVPGFGYRTSIESLRSAIQSFPDVRKAVVGAEVALRSQAMQNAACNGMHSVEQRCCRWLLMSRDRADSDILQLTHEFLAEMLGVRRASVSEVLRPLQVAGIISSNRGTVTILNRPGLEPRVCECYRRIANRELE